MFFNSHYCKGTIKFIIGAALIIYGIIGGPDSRVSLVTGAVLIIWGVVRLRGGTGISNRKSAPGL